MLTLHRDVIKTKTGSLSVIYTKLHRDVTNIKRLVHCTLSLQSYTMVTLVYLELLRTQFNHCTNNWGGDRKTRMQVKLYRVSMYHLLLVGGHEMLQISMQTARDRKRTRVSVMKLIYCSAISGFFLTLQHHIPRYAEQFPMFFGEGIPFPTYRFLHPTVCFDGC